MSLLHCDKSVFASAECGEDEEEALKPARAEHIKREDVRRRRSRTSPVMVGFEVRERRFENQR